MKNPGHQLPQTLLTCCLSVDIPTTGARLTVRTKIATRLYALEEALKVGEHLKSAEGILYTLILIRHASKSWRVLTDEERGFVNAAQFAFEGELEWS